GCFEQHWGLASGNLACAQALYRAFPGAPPHGLGCQQLRRIPGGVVPVVPLHFIVLARDQTTPNAVTRAREAREKTKRVGVNETRLLGGYARAFGIVESRIDRESRVLASFGKLDSALDRQSPRMP